MRRQRIVRYLLFKGQLFIILLLMTTVLTSACGRVNIIVSPTETTAGSTTTTTRTTGTTTTGGAVTTATTMQTTSSQTVVPTETVKEWPTRAGIYGNSAGNLANGGFAAYDVMTGRHLLAVGNRLILHDPETGDNEVLVTLEFGAITHINVGTDYNYYLSTLNDGFYRINRDGSDPVQLADGRCSFAGRYEHYLQIVMDDQLYWIDEADGGPLRATNSGTVSDVSLGSNRVYYRTSDGTIRVCSNTGMGKSTIYDGSDLVDLHHLLRVDENTMAYVDVNRQGTGETVYTVTYPDAPVPLMERDGYSAIPSLYFNSYSGDYYLIAAETQGGTLYRVTPGSGDPVALTRLDSPDYSVNLVDDQLYLKHARNGQVMWIDPVLRTAYSFMP